MDRGHGAASLAAGELEVMLHRRCAGNDGKGNRWAAARGCTHTALVPEGQDRRRCVASEIAAITLLQ